SGLKSENEPVVERAQRRRVLIAYLRAVVVTDLGDHLENRVVDVAILHVRADLEPLVRRQLTTQLQAQVVEIVVPAPAVGDIVGVGGAGIGFERGSIESARQLLLHMREEIESAR